jgi:hypothetical protein
MTTISGRVLLIGLVLLCGACSTELTVSPLRTESIAPGEGWIYSLPYARYKVSIVRTLDKCETDKQDRPTLFFHLTVTAAPLFEADPSQTFVIDNDSLSSWFKTSELSIDRHDNGMLKSIGASAEDRTGKLIVNTIAGVIKLSQAALMAPVSLAPGVPPPSAESICNKALLDIVKELGPKRAVLNAAKDNLEAETKRLTFFADAVATFGKAPADQIQMDLITQAERVATRQIELGRVQKDLQSTLDSISDVDAFTWPGDGRTLVGTHKYSKGNLRRFLADNLNRTDVRLSDVEIELRIRPLSALALSADEDGKLPIVAIGANAKGIRYRAPVQGALEITLCEAVPHDVDDKKPTEFCSPEKIPDKLRVMLLAEGPVPQLGRMMLLPFTNRPFQSNTMKASFTDAGNLQTASVEEKVSQAEVASDTLNQVAGPLLQGITNLRTAGIDAKTAVLKAKTDQLLAERNYHQAVLALEPSGTEANDRQKAIIESDTALKEALRANNEADRALKKEQAAQ